MPTVIYYDSNGSVCAVGGETTYDGIEIDAAEGKWTKAEWYFCYFLS